MNLKNKKNIAVLLIALTIIAGGCSKKESPKVEQKKPNAQEQKIEVDLKDKVEEEKKEEEKNKIVKEENLTEKIKKEDVVADGQVYFQGDNVIATMVVKDGAKEEEVKKKADQYAKDLKKKYADKKVNVQAVGNGKNIANVVIE